MSRGISFRSERMSLIQLYVPIEMMQQTLYEIGEIGLVEFRDLNEHMNAFERPFINEISRLTDMEQKLTYIKEKIKGANLFTTIPSSSKQDDTGYFTHQELDKMENSISELHQRLKKIEDSLTLLGENYMKTQAHMIMLKEVKEYISTGSSKDISTTVLADGAEPAADKNAEEVYDVNSGPSRFMFVSGVIRRAIMPLFEQIVFRSLRGNSYMQISEIEGLKNPVGDDLTSMVAFAIFVHGQEVLKKMEKICSLMCYESMKVDCHSSDLDRRIKEYESSWGDVSNAIEHIKNTLNLEITNASEIVGHWSVAITKSKAIYCALSMFNIDANTGRKALIGEGWCPTLSIGIVRDSLNNVSKNSGTTLCPFLSVLRTKGCTLPTYIKTNKFTSSAQALVNAFSIPSYGEVNPAIFVLITFPFLFSIMFGDFGHGAVFVITSMAMIWYEKRLEERGLGEMFQMIFSGRYSILLMGLFSMYSGVIYSDAFSLPLHIFQSGWSRDPTTGLSIQRGTCVFGLDTAWHSASNSLSFVNSYKMKMSIIVGVIHMVFGLSISLINFIHFNDIPGIITKFIPQIIFMLSLFGYLAFLIVLKWCITFEDVETAPSILSIMISMVMSPGTVSQVNRLYPGQAVVQTFLLLAALISIPWMVFAHPLYEHYSLKKTHLGKSSPVPGGENNATENGSVKEDGYVLISFDQTSETNNGTLVNPQKTTELPEAEDAEYNGLADGIIRSGIHAVEFCLNGLSNTASYLRLWALSLAHSELSKIMWDMIMANALRVQGWLLPFILIICFIMWTILSVAALICMEGLSTYLHALRLHWVEFQGKFFIGGGVLFTPFSFTKILSVSEL